VLISIPAYILGVPDLYYMAFIPSYVFTYRMVPQIWRLVTNFFITGPKLGMILDPYFLFTYCSSLETTAARFSSPGDFFVYLVFCCVIILVRSSITAFPFDDLLLPML
jgi:Derlin-2/3